MALRKLAGAVVVAMALDWPGALERVELYSALIVATPQDDVARTLLLAAQRDREISPAQWQMLRVDMQRRAQEKR